MNTKSVLVLVVGLLGGAVLFHFLNPSRGTASAPHSRGDVLPSRAEAASGSGSSRIAFVDLTTVFGSCRQAKALEVSLNQCKSQGGEQLKAMHDEGAKLEEQLKNLSKDAPERVAMEAQLRQKAQEYALAAEPWERDLAKMRLKGREKLYTHARTVIERLAKERGFDLVISDIEDPHPNLGGTSSEEIIQAFDSYAAKTYRKTVLYAGREADLTQAVLDVMNAEPGS